LTKAKKLFVSEGWGVSATLVAYKDLPAKIRKQLEV
jgi:hypothetical protein